MFCHFFDNLFCEGLRDCRGSDEDVRFDFLHDCEEVIVLFALPLIVLAGVWPLGGCEFIALRLEE